MIKQILWDWNGTLLDDLQYGMDVRNRIFPTFNLPTINSIQEYHAQFTFPIRLYYERAGVTDEIFVPIAHAWMDEYVEPYFVTYEYFNVYIPVGQNTVHGQIEQPCR